jgi:hypothetical protein
MFLRRTERKKNGKTHSYWNVVENKRPDDGRVVQRHVLYLGEINSSQAAAWRKAIEVFDEDAGRSRTLALFPEDRCEVAAGDASAVQLRLSEMRLQRPRQWGACGWPGSCGRSFSSIGSGPIACRRIGRERGGIRFCKFSPATG